MDYLTFRALWVIWFAGNHPRFLQQCHVQWLSREEFSVRLVLVVVYCLETNAESGVFTRFNLFQIIWCLPWGRSRHKTWVTEALREFALLVNKLGQVYLNLCLILFWSPLPPHISVLLLDQQDFPTQEAELGAGHCSPPAQAVLADASSRLK